MDSFQTRHGEKFLLTKYVDCCMQLGATVRGYALAKQFYGLLRRYGEPTRHYHTPAHLMRVVTEFERVKSEFERPYHVLAALFYAQSVSNVLPQKSADYWKFIAPGALGIENKMAVIAVRDMIAFSGPHPSADRPHDRDTALFLDIELAIIGSEPSVYDESGSAFRRECREHYTDDQWATVRIECFLDPLLQSKTIFYTTEFEAHYGERARANLMEERVQLQRIISR